MKSMLAAALLATSALAVATPAADKPVIGTISDLPPTRFPFAAPPSTLIDSPEFAAMLPAVRREAERLLTDYEIKDATIAQELRVGLASIALLDGRRADADRLVAEYRAAASKPQSRAVGAMSLDLIAATLDRPAGAACRAAAARFTERVKGLDPVLVRDPILRTYSGIQTASAPFYAGVAVGLLDPVVKERGSLDVLGALELAYFRLAARTLPPCRAELSKAARAWIDAPANKAIDIWPARQPADGEFAAAKPVTVAVWDSGYDVTLFPGQLAHDPAEPVDGRDNDGDGVIDDTNGPTFDHALRPRASAIMPPTNFLRSRMASTMAFQKGELDLGYGLDTSEAAMFAEFARTASVAEQGDEFLATMEAGTRSHGTACASEIADGAPYVRLYNVAALPWARNEAKQDIAYDEAVIARWAAAIDRIGPRMRGAGVRVVSMSWGLTADEITQQLLDHKLEADPVKAKARGIAMQKTIGDALERLVGASPNLLFVVAAGNSNQTADVQGDAIQRLKLPNILVVGATGTNGKPTTFSVFGPSVAIYAQGDAVPLRWPGDMSVRTSGTSMAAPLVARAAAQMLAVNPKLSAVQVRTGMLETATADDGFKLLHPAAAVGWAKRN